MNDEQLKKEFEELKDENKQLKITMDETVREWNEKYEVIFLFYLLLIFLKHPTFVIFNNF